MLHVIVCLEALLHYTLEGSYPHGKCKAGLACMDASVLEDDALHRLKGLLLGLGLS